MKKYLLFALTAIVLVIGAVTVIKNQYAAPVDEEATAPTETTAAPVAKKPQPAPLTKPSAYTNSGIVVFGIKDKAVPVDSIKSVVITVNEIDVHGPKGWVAASKTPRQYDLVSLHALSATELFSDTRFEIGTYDQIRLLVSKVLVTTADGRSAEAKLPSGELKMNTQLTVAKNETSGVTIDFDFNKSLHMTGEGTFIFAPVVSLETRDHVTVQKFPNNRVDILGGAAKFHADYGMDEAGAVKVNFTFDPLTEFSLSNGKIKITPKAPAPIIKITAEAATSQAIGNKTIDIAVSVKLETRAGKFVWKITGKKDLADVTVYVDVTTGQVVAVE